MRLVQLESCGTRRLALVDEPFLRLLDAFTSVYELAQMCIANGSTVSTQVEGRLSEVTLNYDDVYLGRSEWPYPADGESSRRSGASFRVWDWTDSHGKREKP